MGRHRRNSSDDSANDDINQANIVDEFAANIPDQEPSVVEGGVEWGKAVEYCLNVPRVYVGGLTFMDVFNQDDYTHQRTEVPWYPFASQKDWEVAYWLMRTNLSMSEIDEYLNLSFTKENSLLFHHTKELHQWVEMLPSGPRWKYEDILTDFPMKHLLRIFYRDPIDCLQSLLSNPQLADCINFNCQRVYKSVDRLSRVYSSFMMGDHSWYLQCQVPQGAVMIVAALGSKPVFLILMLNSIHPMHPRHSDPDPDARPRPESFGPDSFRIGLVLPMSCPVVSTPTDKTKVTNISGNRYTHPVLISLANIASSMCAKVMLHAYLLVALIPVPKFVHSNVRVRGVLVDRLFHQCLSIVTESLKAAAKMGIMMNDPIGNSRYCFTPLVSYVADTPEELLFKDPFRHPLHKGLSTLARIKAVLRSISHADVSKFFVTCKKFNLNGIHEPFWLDWPLSDPSQFITPEALHHWHRMFWDHDLNWCIFVVSVDELDFRFMLLQVFVGYRSFKDGISTLKQVSVRDH
ncbi:uncharacterized protein EDB93DRAFT_1253070 [Suillus bovinus]|uniref:uncharacterized protein n=1 Tax=Suillus bovinus TaxID=48563 RepID=UPI001B8848D2|nr:uncharacterized protein EDB93DRAFT_1253070 [Suillus bovinus]KAG2139145.1 hypothetical protein EDB93DRAFT_1253070 [Suillus bovinus]